MESRKRRRYRRRTGEVLAAALRRADVAVHSADAAAVTASRDELWELQTQLMPDLIGRNAELAAGALFDVARASTQFEFATEQWHRALASSTALSAALTQMDAELTARGSFLPSGLIERLFRHADLAVCAAHRAGAPLSGTLVVESLTATVLAARTLHGHLLEQVRIQDRRALLARLDTLRRQQQEYAARLPHLPRSMELTASDLPGIVQEGFRTDLCQLLTLEGAGVDVVPLLGPSTATAYAQHKTGRAVIHVAAGPNGGCAVLLDPSDLGRTMSIDLPRLTFDAVQDWSRRIGEAFVMARSGAIGRRGLSVRLQCVLIELGAATWEAMAEVWPQLPGMHPTLIQVGEVASLPLASAYLDHRPFSAVSDVSTVPSGYVMALAAARRPLSRQEPLVLGDEGSGENRISMVADEVERIATLYGVEPVQLTTHGGSAGDPLQCDVHPALQALGRCTVAHLACHGAYSPESPLDSALVLGGQLRLGDLARVELTGQPLVVLSGCELANVGRAAPAEQLGFPQTLLAMGARGVVGALWPVPDSRDTVDVMVALHEHLQSNDPAEAIRLTIAGAHAADLPVSVWGSLTYYGV